MRTLLPVILILFCSEVCFSDSCCKKKVRISGLFNGTIDVSKLELIPGTEENGFTNCRPLDCTDLYKRGYNKSGVYTIWPINRLMFKDGINVYCDMTDGGWTVIQRRGDFGNPHDYFNQDWATYKKGFGNLEKDFWLGNDNVFALTNQRPYSVSFDLEGKAKSKTYALYDSFWIDDELNNYRIHISRFSGTAGDAMEKHDTLEFATKDKNDKNPDFKCAKRYSSGWWFGTTNFCFQANLNGLYYNETSNKVLSGVNWNTLSVSKQMPLLLRVEIKIKSLI